MELVFDLTSLEAYLSDKPDHLVVEQLLLSGSMKYTHDIVLDALYEERNRAVGATLAHKEIERLQNLLVVWNYPMFDADAARLQEEYDLSYSAAVCTALAQQTSCPIVTASHHSFDAIMENGVCGVLFTR